MAAPAPDLPFLLAQKSRQFNCEAPAASWGHRGVPADRPGSRWGAPAPTYLLQQRDGVPAVVQTRGEAGRGGRVVVLGGLGDELGDGDLVRHPAGGARHKRGRGVSHGAGSRGRGPPGGS